MRWAAVVDMARLVLATGFLLLMILFLSLGTWQLRRADERALVYEQFVADADRPALTAPIDSRRLEEYRYRRLELRGYYLSSRQLLLDSMTHQGQVGYHVLTPFRPLHSRRWLLVNRGWVRADPNRQVLPQIDVSETPRVVRGRIDTLPRPGLRLETSVESGGWPQVVLFPTFDELETRLEEPVFRYQLLLDPDIAYGFVRDWRPRTMTPERHRGYALLWFSFAGVLVLMGVVLSLHSTRGRDAQS